jgi:putative nucleotidyltransferase with HDIG domain
MSSTSDPPTSNDAREQQDAPARGASSVDARALLAEAQAREVAGDLVAAAEGYTAAATAASEAGLPAVRAEALRCLGRVRFMQQDPAGAEALLRESLAVADAAGDDVLAAEALNALGALDLHRGALVAARASFEAAMRRGGDAIRAQGSAPGLRGHLEQNLGVIANIEGDLPTALAHYDRSLAAFRQAGNQRGSARALNNMGMASADLRDWDAADGYFRRCLAEAEQLGDVHLRGLGLLNHTEVLLEHERYAEARESAEAALGIFDRLGVPAPKADAYRVIGVVYRQTGRAVLAEARLQDAIDLAARSGAVLAHAESCRELARLYRDMGRNIDALRLLNTAHGLFRQLGARVDLRDITAKVADLQGTYLAVVRDWGRSIESKDSYTHGHCERVADYAVELGRAIGLAGDELTTLHMGAYLHDVGKVRVPHEILTKPGRLTDEEFVLMQRHPEYGIELLDGIDFPWDIRPIIRWHHERNDGTGYPDRMRGDALPLSAQIICAADVYDALTSTRSYRAAMSAAAAVAEMRRMSGHWRADVLEAVLDTIARPTSETDAATVHAAA